MATGRGLGAACCLLRLLCAAAAGGNSGDSSDGLRDAADEPLPAFLTPADGLHAGSGEVKFAARSRRQLEVNFCSKIEENTGFSGMDIRYANKTNHWFPATISTCCASCRASLLLGAPSECACWVWGYNNNKDCQEGDFKDGEGCCWLKRASEDGTKCTAGKSKSKSQNLGFFLEGLPQDTELPGSGPSGWFIVVVICTFLFGGTAYSRVSPGFGRNLTGLVHDGLAFSMSAAGYTHPMRPKRGDYSAVKSEATPGPAAAAAAGGVGPAVGAAASSSSSFATGQRTALHAAAAVGDLTRLQSTLARDATAVTVDAPDSRGYTAFHVACAGGHADCVVALAEAGALTTLANDVGLTGWELAAQLQRTEIAGLDRAALEKAGQKARAKAVAGAGGGDKGKEKRSKTRAAAGGEKKVVPPKPSFAAQQPAAAVDSSLPVESGAAAGPKTVVL